MQNPGAYLPVARLVGRFWGRGPSPPLPNIASSRLQHAGGVYRSRPRQAISVYIGQTVSIDYYIYGRFDGGGGGLFHPLTGVLGFRLISRNMVFRW